MAHLDVTITSASGETDFISTGPEGRAFIGVTGTISAGAILCLVKLNGGSTEFAALAIDQTAIQQLANEAGDGYSYFEEVRIPSNASLALAANASFSGSVVVSVWPERY